MGKLFAALFCAGMLTGYIALLFAFPLITIFLTIVIVIMMD